MDDKSYSLRSKLLVCLTVAVVAVFIGVAVKTLTPVVVGEFLQGGGETTDTVPYPQPGDAEISLDPNLSAENYIAQGEAVFAATGWDKISYIVYNVGEEGYVARLGDALAPSSTANLGARAASACLTQSGAAVAAVADGESFLYFIGSDGKITRSERSYPGQTPVFTGFYDDCVAAVFTSEGAAGKRIVFRLFRDGAETCERYANLSYDIDAVEMYRTGDIYTLFYRFSSQFSRGGGYALFSPETVSVTLTDIERSDGYDFLSVIPSRESFAMLCSDADGTFIMQLDENLDRSEKITLTDYAALSGRLSFDGKNYYAFVGGASEGRMFRLDAGGEKTRIAAYDTALSVAGEYNTGGALLHLLGSKNGFFLTDTNGLFTKKVSKPGAAPVAMLRTGGSVAAVCNLSEQTSGSGGEKQHAVYIALFN